MPLSRRIGLRLIEAQCLHTAFPTGTNGSQNHLMLGAGLMLRLHGSLWTPDPGRQRAKANKAMRKEEKAADTAAMGASTPPPPAPAPEPAPRHPAVDSSASAAEFTGSVKSAFFDYDSYRTDPIMHATFFRSSTLSTNQPQRTAALLALALNSVPVQGTVTQRAAPARPVQQYVTMANRHDWSPFSE